MKPYLIHLTDIFHPHGDPDDHYDLAQAFALHKAGLVELGCVVCDWPPAHRVGDPALCAVAQLNALTGSCVEGRVAPEDFDEAGRQILDLMRRAPRPVTFTIVGSTESVASALRQEPDLFREKCAAIIPVAGSAEETPGGMLEYNVRLHPEAYTALFSAPCPVLWTCCFQTLLPEEPGKDTQLDGPNASCYCVYQREILDALQPGLQNYFLYMLTRSSDPRYLRYLSYPVDREALAGFGAEKRRLWSTPGLFAAAGVAMDTVEYVPVQVTVYPEGHLTWEPCEEGESRVRMLTLKTREEGIRLSFDTTGAYKEEMTAKLRDLLASL